MKTFLINNQDETIELGKRLGNVLESGDVVLLEGDLSSGKTTFTKGIGIALGVTKIINSPTFTIVKAYKGKDTMLYHLDLYRLDGLNNDFDLYEYIEGDGITVIEWPHQVEDILPKEYILVEILRTYTTKRTINIKAIGKKYEKKVEEM